VMEKASLLERIKNSNKYRKMLPKDRVQYRKRKLFELVTYAKENSPLYSKHYENLTELFTQKDIPVMDRSLLVNNYDSWATDREVSLEGIQSFMEEFPKGDKKYLDKYYVTSTSGMYDEALVCLHDEASAQIMSVEYLLKSFSRREHFWGFLTHGARLASIFSDKGYYFPNEFARMRSDTLPFRKKKSIMLSSLQSTSGCVSGLNEFKPAMLSGFPSALLRLADEKKVSRLKISPVCISYDGEAIDDSQRKKISENFKCDVSSMYSNAFTGCIAYECREHHLHINDDRIILEAVNEAGEPVMAGQASDKILVTNLTNYIHPIIRYEIGDRVIVHEEGCLCGNYSPWIEIVGKNLDQIIINVSGREIMIPVKELEAVLNKASYLKRYQIIVNQNAHFSLRLTGARNVDKTMAFFKAEKELRTYFKSVGLIAPVITLEKEDPKPHPLSGKYQKIIVE